MPTRTCFVLRNLVALSACITLIATPCSAQSGARGQVELGAFGTSAEVGDTVALDRGFGAGAHLGYFFTNAFSFEATGDYLQTKVTSTGQRVDVTRMSATLLAHQYASPWAAFYVGAGIERVFFDGAVNESLTGFHGVLGNRLSLGGRAALRIEGHGTFSPAVKFTVSAGLSVFAFGGPPRDEDQDLVPDKNDLCPRTPIGASVDLSGCPSDTDGDEILDGIDACPQTPSGATVDQLGCPSDTDGDEVFDGIDACPNTPRGVETDARGCATDEDADGVFDGLDNCPGTPAGANIDEAGCPLDSDNDEVFDGIDRCPGTPYGVLVDQTGCPTDTDGDGVLNSDDACPATPLGNPGRL